MTFDSLINFAAQLATLGRESVVAFLHNDLHAATSAIKYYKHLLADSQYSCLQLNKICVSYFYCQKLVPKVGCIGSTYGQTSVRDNCRSVLNPNDADNQPPLKYRPFRGPNYRLPQIVPLKFMTHKSLIMNDSDNKTDRSKRNQVFERDDDDDDDDDI